MSKTEQMDKAIKKQKNSENSQNSLQKISQTIPTFFKKKENHFEISTYQGELTKKGITENLALIKAAFPKLENMYFNILKTMLKEDNFCDERLKDAVYHVIKTCVYPEPTIANFLSYDKNFKVYDYNQYLKLVDELGAKTSDLYKSVRFNNEQNKPVWVHVNDIENYKLELWNK